MTAYSHVKLGDEVPLAIDGDSAHLFGPDGAGFIGRPHDQRHGTGAGCCSQRPFLALYALILIFPLLRGLWLSLNQVDLFGEGHFVGFGNYARLLRDPIFATSLVNTFEVTLMIVPALTVIALLLALALNRAGGGAAVVRGIFFSSAVLSVTIVTLIWRFMLAPDAGLLGEAWKAFGWEPLPFLSDVHLVLPALAITTIWWSVGFPMLLFLAGLQQIPEDMYEAAALDNASRWTTFWRITLPSLRRTIDPRRDAANRSATAAVRPVAIADRRRPERRVTDRRAVPVRDAPSADGSSAMPARPPKSCSCIILAVTLTQYWATGRAAGAHGGR